MSPDLTRLVLEAILPWDEFACDNLRRL